MTARVPNKVGNVFNFYLHWYLLMSVNWIEWRTWKGQETTTRYNRQMTSYYLITKWYCLVTLLVMVDLLCLYVVLKGIPCKVIGVFSMLLVFIVMLLVCEFVVVNIICRLYLVVVSCVYNNVLVGIVCVCLFLLGCLLSCDVFVCYVRMLCCQCLLSLRYLFNGVVCSLLVLSVHCYYTR